MQTIVTCSECQRKLKVATTALGKSVKCVCGAVFTAQESAETGRAPEADESLIVACDGCQTKLRVPASARGRKMKCAKCGTIFVAEGTSGASRETPIPAVQFAAPRVAAAPPVLHDSDFTEEEPPARPKAFAMEPDEERPRRRKAAPTGSSQYPSSLIFNLLVLVIFLGYVVAFLPVYFGLIDLSIIGPERIMLDGGGGAGGKGGMVAPPPPPPLDPEDLKNPPPPPDPDQTETRHGAPPPAWTTPTPVRRG